jgi:hypothetical protein
MSLKHPMSVNCPKCNHAQNVIVWNSLNVQSSPEAKPEFLNSKINVFECEGCKSKANLVVPFMYHDMELQLCVQYHPSESLDKEETLELYKPDGSSAADLFGPLQPSAEVLEKAKYMLYPHVVFSMQEALLYVMFRERLAEFHRR